MKIARARFLPIAIVSLAISVAFNAPASAQLSWTATGNETLGGNGTWDTVGTTWWNGSTATTWVNNSTASFAGGDGTYAITLGSNVTVNAGNTTVGGLNFINSGYTLSAASAQTISLGTNNNTAIIRVGSGKTGVIGNNVTVNKGVAAQIAIIGGGTLEVATGGRLIQTNSNVTEISGNSTLKISGGNVTVATSMVVGNFGTAGASGRVIMDSGTLAINSNNLIIGRTAGDNSSVTINGGNMTVANNINFGNGGQIVTGAFNLNGGNVTVTGNITNAGANSTATFNFNGGTLRAGGNRTAFMQGITQANVQAGGANIDSNGFNITIAQSLLAAGGGLTKLGAGNLTLSGANGYTGTTTVSEGTLILSSTGSIASSTIGFGVKDAANGLLSVQNTGFSFSGNVTLDLASVTVSTGSWTLFGGSAFDAADLSLANVTSNLAGLTFTNSSGIWSGTDLSSRTWTFTEDTGVLQVVPEPTTWALLGLGLAATLLFRRRSA